MRFDVQRHKAGPAVIDKFNWNILESVNKDPIQLPTGHQRHPGRFQTVISNPCTFYYLNGKKVNHRIFLNEGKLLNRPFLQRKTHASRKCSRWRQTLVVLTLWSAAMGSLSHKREWRFLCLKDNIWGALECGDLCTLSRFRRMAFCQLGHAFK